jgi:hypothetical protein
MGGELRLSAGLELERETDRSAPEMERSGSENRFGGGGKAFPVVEGSRQQAGLERHLWVSQSPWFCKRNLK